MTTKFEIICPEGHGKSIISLTIKEHRSGRYKEIVDLKAVAGLDCNQKDKLLKINSNCDTTCTKTDEYKNVVNNVTKKLKLFGAY